MQKIKKTTDINMKRAMVSFAALSLIVILSTLILPSNKLALQAYDLSDQVYRVITFLLILPPIIVIITGFYAYAKLYQYSASIDNPEEKVFFRQIARGAMWLAWSIPLWLLMGAALREYLNRFPDSLPEYRLIITYSNIILPLIGFSIIGHTLHFQLRKLKFKYKPKNVRRVYAGFFIGAFIYCLALFNQIGFTRLSSSRNVYHMPSWLIVLTIVIPLLYTWIVGLLVGDKINHVSKSMEGVLYRRYLHQISRGLIIVIASMVAFQLSSTLVYNPGYFQLNSGMVVLQFLAIIHSVGFAMIALGASKLKKFEEI